MHQRTLIRTILLLLVALIVSACSSPVTTAPNGTAVADASNVGATADAEATTIPTPESSPTAASRAEPTEAPTGESTTEPSDAPTEAATEATAATETLSYTQILDPKWSQDSDGNLVPDFIEVEAGNDPQADDCAQQACGAGATGADFNQERNTLLILDSSGSMAGQVAGGNKLDVAKKSLSRYAKVASVATKLGFLVYGHKGNNTDAGKAESCVGIDLLSPIGQFTRENVDSVLSQFQPTGWTPIAASLTKAQEAFAGKEGQINRIILLSDGIETCEGDPVAIAQQLNEQGLAITIDVIGFDVASGSADQAQLQQIAKVSDGQYFNASTADELDQFLQQQSKAILATYDALTCELNNYRQVAICESSLVTRTQRAIDDEIRTLGYDTSDPRVQAYDQLRNLLTERLNQRDQIANASISRADDLQQQLEQLRAQFREAYGTDYSP